MTWHEFQQDRLTDLADLQVFVPFILQLPRDPLPGLDDVLSPGPDPGDTLNFWKRDFFEAAIHRDWLNIHWGDLHLRFHHLSGHPEDYPRLWAWLGDPLQDRIIRAALHDFATDLFPAHARENGLPRDHVQAQFVGLCRHACETTVQPAVLALVVAVTRVAEVFHAFGPDPDAPAHGPAADGSAAIERGQRLAREALQNPFALDRLAFLQASLPVSARHLLPRIEDPPEAWIALADTLLNEPGTSLFGSGLRPRYRVSTEQAVLLLQALRPMAAAGAMRLLHQGRRDGYPLPGWTVALAFGLASLAPATLALLAPSLPVLREEVDAALEAKHLPPWPAEPGDAPPTPAKASDPLQSALRLRHRLTVALQTEPCWPEPGAPLDPVPNHEAGDRLIAECLHLAYMGRDLWPTVEAVALAATLLAAEMLCHGLVLAMHPEEGDMAVGARVILDASLSRRQAFADVTTALTDAGLERAQARLVAWLEALPAPPPGLQPALLQSLASSEARRSVAPWSVLVSACLQPWAIPAPFCSLPQGSPRPGKGAWPFTPVYVDARFLLQPELAALPPLQQLQLLRIVLPIATAAALQALTGAEEAGSA